MSKTSAHTIIMRIKSSYDWLLIFVPLAILSAGAAAPRGREVRIIFSAQHNGQDARWPHRQDACATSGRGGSTESRPTTVPRTQMTSAVRQQGGARHKRAA